MANLAIKGHRIQGDKVIKLLEILGGKNNHHYLGHNDSWVYYINKEGCITLDFDVSKFSVFTLEDFLEKFPYKVGDKVLYHQTYAVINKMKWNGEEIEYVVECKKELWETTIFYLEPYKEETMEKEISGAIIDRFICLEGYDFYDDKGNVIDTKEIIMKKKQPKYPKTYEDCCKVLLLNPERATYSVCGLEYKRHLIVNFQRLLVCRDAYWKITGNWKPNFTNYEEKFIITYLYGKVYSTVSTNYNRVLVFPTEEMRDAFYENFKKLIEECKELL
jgi:hypothetical protein